MDGRRLAVLLLAAVAVVGLGAAVAWQQVVGDDPRPERLTLADLVFGQEDYSGRRVRTSGVVQRFGPEDGALRLHYVISDEADNRVRLEGGDPARYVGRVVDVVGRFRMTDRGRTIDVERIVTR